MMTRLLCEEFNLKRTGHAVHLPVLLVLPLGRRDEVVRACEWAMQPSHYCMYIKGKNEFETMTCEAPLGGIVKRKKFECMYTQQCNGIKSALHNTCVNNECRMKYKRIVEVGMVVSGMNGDSYWNYQKPASDNDYKTNRCDKMGLGWEVVEVCAATLWSPPQCDY